MIATKVGIDDLITANGATAADLEQLERIEAWPVLAERYDESTRRMFEYFFLTGAGAFHARLLQYWHLVLTPTTRRTPGPRLT